MKARVLRRFVLPLLGCFLAIAAPQSISRAASKTTDRVLQGKLVTLSGKGPVLQTSGKNYPLAGRNQYIFQTLQDKGLQGKELKIEGAMRPDGNFQVSDFFTIHDGKLYRVRYYCETCNIAANAPGNCVCCQQPTELQEVPVDSHDKNVLITH